MTNYHESSLPLTPEERVKLEGLQVPVPDEVLKPLERSILGKTILISVAVHVALLLVTSVSLYRDWARYGLKLPTEIRQLKKQERIEADKKQREADLKKREEELVKKAEAVGDGEGGDTTGSCGTKPAVPKDIDPADPIKSFELDDNLFDL